MLPSVSVVVGIHNGIQAIVEKEDSPFRTDTETIWIEVISKACLRANHNRTGTVGDLHTSDAAIALMEKHATIRGYTQQGG